MSQIRTSKLRGIDFNRNSSNYWRLWIQLDANGIQLKSTAHAIGHKRCPSNPHAAQPRPRFDLIQRMHAWVLSTSSLSILSKTQIMSRLVQGIHVQIMATPASEKNRPWEKPQQSGSGPLKTNQWWNKAADCKAPPGYSDDIALAASFFAAFPRSHGLLLLDVFVVLHRLFFLAFFDFDFDFDHLFHRLGLIFQSFHRLLLWVPAVLVLGS